MTNLRYYFLRFDGQFNHWRCLSRKPVVSAKHHRSKARCTFSHEGTSVPKLVLCSLKSHVVCNEFRRDYSAGIITVVIISIEQQCSITGRFKRQFRKCPFVLKNSLIFLLVCPKTGLFSVNLTDKGERNGEKMQFFVFCKFGG